MVSDRSIYLKVVNFSLPKITLTILEGAMKPNKFELILAQKLQMVALIYTVLTKTTTHSGFK
jgi:hypothetical protein